MFDPIYDPGLDDYGESTYKIVDYDVDSETILVSEQTLEEVIFEGTGREVDELLEFGRVIVICERKTYSLDEFLEMDIKNFIGKDVEFETE